MVHRQVPVPVSYRGRDLGLGFRIDLLVEGWLLLELKAVQEFTDQHLSQVITYLRMLELKKGFLLNFNKKVLKDGIKKVSL